MRHPILNLGCAALARKEDGVCGNGGVAGRWAALLVALVAKKNGLDAFALITHARWRAMCDYEEGLG